MSSPPSWPKTRVPPRALIISLAALAVPVAAVLFFPPSARDYEAMLWLLALVPAFLLAYYRGWRGVAVALAAGMAALAGTQATAQALGRGVHDWPLFAAVVTAYIGIALGLGWLADRMHRDRVEAEQLALTDPLTGLPNRRHARLFLEKEFAAAQRGRELAVVLFDIDRFKDYNDRNGHAAGDAVLRGFAEVLNYTTRRMNLSARYGGEEFISMLSGSDEDGTLVFIDRVRERLRKAQLPGGSVTVSAGLATYHPGMQTADDLVAAADQALYEAKQAGRDCVRVYGRPVEV